MMLADARLPVGGHVHSAGLEPALAAGMPANRVFDYLLGRAHSVSLVEAGTAVVARHVALPATADSVAAGLAAVESAWAARTPSRALREVSRSLGRGYLRLGTRLWPGHPGIDACSAAPSPLSRPVVLGAIAAAANLDAESLVRLVIYDDAQTVAAALLKLAPIDPAIPAGWVLRACGEVDHLVAAIAALTSPDAIPASGAPQTEEWAESHSLTTQRLFRA
ncbi:urease accessory protein [Lacisediminihabitans profunda]|uniref:Urease accessory protein n=2 Tax=Lacisediminihabitans profunda TaxID=2594790 RepID=A0A5C8UNE6_9MICO|nr:urease accessory protein [Lacisediminihabitans profunda]